MCVESWANTRDEAVTFHSHGGAQTCKLQAATNGCSLLVAHFHLSYSSPYHLSPPSHPNPPSHLPPPNHPPYSLTLTAASSSQATQRWPAFSSSHSSSNSEARIRGPGFRSTPEPAAQLTAVLPAGRGAILQGPSALARPSPRRQLQRQQQVKHWR